MTHKLIVLAVSLTAALSVHAQLYNPYQVHTMPLSVRPNPLLGGYDVRGSGGYYQTIRPNPLLGGYDVQGPGNLRQSIRPNPLLGGYDIR